MIAKLEQMSREQLLQTLKSFQKHAPEDSSAAQALNFAFDLHVHQIELEMQNRELRDAQRSLEESRDRYAELFDFAPVGYCIFDVHGRILDVNLTAATLLRRDRQYLIGRPFSSIVTLHQPQNFRAHVRDCFTHRDTVTTELSVSPKGSEPLVLQLVSTPRVERDREVTRCKTMLTDVTALKRSEQGHRILSRAAELLASARDYDKTVALIVRLAVPALADVCVLDVISEDGTLVRAEAAFADPRRQVLVGSGIHPSTQTEITPGDVLRCGEPILIPDTATTSHPLYRVPGVQHSRSLMLIPLIARRRSVGVLSFVSEESGRRFGQAEFALAQDFGRHAALAIDNALLFKAAAAASRARDDVLAIVSHDLKNPLSAIQLRTSSLLLALRDQEPGNTHKQLRKIRQSCEQMTRLVQDLLDLGSLDSGHLSVDKAPCAIRDLFGEACDLLEPLATEHKLELDCDAGSDALVALGDRRRLLQVLSNLIGNAIKISPADNTIHLRVQRTDNFLRIAVQDHGPGIAADLLPRVFERYWQGPNAAEGGRGLGLYIAKGVVEAHGGKIWVESTEGMGTTFYFTVPLVEEDAARVVPTADAPGAPR